MWASSGEASSTVDPGLLSLYDKALGEQAAAFVTCTDERATVCTQCARYGDGGGIHVGFPRAFHSANLPRSPAPFIAWQAPA